jgi:hypothetical protein
MTDARIITYRGDAGHHRVLIKLLRDQGVWVVYQAPEEQPGGKTITGEVVLRLTASGAYDDMKLVVGKFRERFPSIRVDIE